ncbi:hypothetical protein T01_14366 [Trichinella spiralis]|uniref:Uncharacterized protein n=1 Tax=Trichinella spiralis TaxID=6334 RepID=A0A0V1BC91_TRISP|nr:hypothetical protein T01_14366 [Trichinella spiralis]
MSQKRCLKSWQSRHVAVSNDKSESNIGQTQYTPHWNECQAEASCSLTGCSSSVAAWNSAMHEQAAPIYRPLHCLRHCPVCQLIPILKISSLSFIHRSLLPLRTFGGLWVRDLLSHMIQSTVEFTCNG